MPEDKKPRILVVDDDPTDLKFLTTLIARYGYDFEIAQNSVEAIEKTKATDPHVILMDILMPEMNGIEACKRLKEDPGTKHIPIIVLTAFGDKEIKIECLNTGANDFLSKPVDSTELIARIKNFLQFKNLEEIKKNNEILTETIKAIENAKREWEQTLDCISDIVLLIDSKDNILRCNKILTTLTGKSYPELLGRKWQDVFKESGFSYKISDSGDIEYSHTNGRFFNFNIYAVKNIGIIAAIVTLQDITERKYREEEIKQAHDIQQALNSILNISLKDMPLIEILTHTLETLLTIPWLAFESRGCIFLVEDDPEVLVMKAQKGLSEPIQKSCARIPFGRCLCGKAALSRKIEFASHINERHEIIYSGIYPHGHYCVPIMFGDRILGVINIYLKEKHKYTQKEETFLTSAANTLAGIIIRKQAEESLATAYTELKSAQSQIIQSEKMASIGQLAAGIAHEINNPVGFIMSNLGSLQKYAGKLSEFIKAQTEAIGELGVKSSEFGETLKKVDALKKSMKIDYIIDDLGNLIRESLDGAERIKKIVQDLKSFSHIDEAEWKMADINAGIESTINIVWNELKYKATVKKEYGDIPLTKCNPGQLNQVFMNMLVNAAHAIEKQGEITVKTWHDSGYIYISISDTGCGIPKENISRIFEPFFTTKEVGKGTGLGLSIAYDIVRKHNGDIIVDSAVGKGTTFTVKIPVVEK